MPGLEHETRIVEMRFGIDIPRDLLKQNLTPRELEVLRACFDGVKTPFEDGTHTLPEAEAELAKLTKVRHELSVAGGKAVVKPVHDGSRPDAAALYGDLSRRLENPGDVYYDHSMSGGKIKSLVACERVTPWLNMTEKCGPRDIECWMGQKPPLREGRTVEGFPLDSQDLLPQEDSRVFSHLGLVGDVVIPIHQERVEPGKVRVIFLSKITVSANNEAYFSEELLK